MTNNIKTICKTHRNDPKTCAAELRDLRPTQSQVAHWSLYCASIGYKEIFEMCVKHIDAASPPIDPNQLLLEACVGGNTDILLMVLEKYRDRIFTQDYPQRLRLDKPLEHLCTTQQQPMLDTLLQWAGEEGKKVGVTPFAVVKNLLRAKGSPLIKIYVTQFLPQLALRAPGHPQIELVAIAIRCCEIDNHVDFPWIVSHLPAEACTDGLYHTLMKEATERRSLEILRYLSDPSVLEKFSLEAYGSAHISSLHGAAILALYQATSQKNLEVLHTLFDLHPYEKWGPGWNTPRYQEKMTQFYADYLKARLEKEVESTSFAPKNRKM